MNEDDYSANWACKVCGAPAKFGVEPGYEYNEWRVKTDCEHHIDPRDELDVVPVPRPE